MSTVPCLTIGFIRKCRDRTFCFFVLNSDLLCQGMEAEDVSRAEDKAENPGSKTEGQPDAAQPDLPHGGQSPGPTALWEMLEKKFLEYQQLAHGSLAEHQQSLLNLLPLFLKVGILSFETIR